MKPPRLVVHTVPALFSRSGTIGGAERYAFELARHMADRVPTRLVTFGDRASQETVGSLEVHVLKRHWRVRGDVHNPFALRLVPELLRAGVVHCHQRTTVASSFAAALGRVTRKPVFVSDLGGGGWDLSAYVPTTRWFTGHLHISQYSRKLSRHIDEPWAHVIYGGVDCAKFSPPPAPPAGRRPVVFVGRLLPHKGVNDLIEAAPPEMPVDVVGRPADDHFLGQLQRLAAGKDVTFRHECSDEDLVAVYRQARCVVLPSVYRSAFSPETNVPELLGQTLLEGMACGVPTICTDVASMPEVVEHGVTGFVVPANDPAALREKLVWLTEHPEEARAMGEAGRCRAMERFHWGAVVDRCLRIYAQA
jgi:glycosyltransferase involved in cell wall biosynthesis